MTLPPQTGQTPSSSLAAPFGSLGGREGRLIAPEVRRLGGELGFGLMLLVILSRGRRNRTVLTSLMKAVPLQVLPRYCKPRI